MSTTPECPGKEDLPLYIFNQGDSFEKKRKEMATEKGKEQFKEQK